jgi:hypothetical protein
LGATLLCAIHSTTIKNTLFDTLLCAIHSTTIKNTLFEDGDDANAFRAFNPTQTFLHLKNKIVIDPLWSADQYTSYCIIM